MHGDRSGWREVGDRTGEAAILKNIGAVYDNLGDRQQALTYYHPRAAHREGVENERKLAIQRAG